MHQLKLLNRPTRIIQKTHADSLKLSSGVSPASISILPSPSKPLDLKLLFLECIEWSSSIKNLRESLVKIHGRRIVEESLLFALLQVGHKFNPNAIELYDKLRADGLVLFRTQDFSTSTIPKKYFYQMLGCLIKSKDIADVKIWLKSLSTDRLVTLDTSILTYILDNQVRPSVQLAELIKVFEPLDEIKESHSVILCSWLKFGYLKQALKFFVKSPIKTSQMYNVLIPYLLRDGGNRKIDDEFSSTGIRLYQEMLTLFRPELESSLAMIEYFMLKNNLALIRKINERLRDENVQYSARGLVLYIEYAFKASDLVLVETLKKEYLSKFQPTIEFTSMLIRGYLKCGKYEDCIAWFNHSNSSQISSRVKDFRFVILAYAQSRRMDLAEKTLEIMTRGNIPITSAEYALMAFGYGISGNMEFIRKYSDLVISDKMAKPVSWYYVLEGHIRLDSLRHVEAIKIYQKMIELKIQRGQDIYERILFVYYSIRDIEKYVTTLEEMALAGFEICDVTLRAMFKVMLGSDSSRSEKNELIQKTWLAMYRSILSDSKKGSEPQRLWFALMENFSMQNRYGQVGLIYEAMVNRGVFPTTETVRLYIHSLGKLKKTEDAKARMIKLINSGTLENVKGSIILYNTQLSVLLHFGLIKKAEKLMQLMISRKSYPNEESWAIAKMYDFDCSFLEMETNPSKK